MICFNELDVCPAFRLDSVLRRQRGKIPAHQESSSDLVNIWVASDGVTPAFGWALLLPRVQGEGRMIHIASMAEERGGREARWNVGHTENRTIPRHVYDQVIAFLLQSVVLSPRKPLDINFTPLIYTQPLTTG